jgi:hypothetical protein
MLWLNHSAIGIDLPATTWTEPDPSNILFSMFKPVFFSGLQLIKIYEVNYTRLDSALEVTGGNAFAVNYVPVEESLNGNMTSVILEVTNPGLHPVEIDRIVFESPNFENAYQYEATEIATTSGSVRLEPGETTIMSAKPLIYLQPGSYVDVTLYALGFEPSLNTTVRLPVRYAPDYNVSVIDSKCYAYENGTIHIELENTGDGYCEIDKIADINGKDISLFGKADRGLVFFTNDKMSITLDAANAADGGLTLTQGETVTLKIFYMSYQPLYAGQNVTISLTVEATPTPSAPSSLPHQTDTSLVNSFTLTCQFRIEQLTIYESALSSSASEESNDFLTARRYLP